MSFAYSLRSTVAAVSAVEAGRNVLRQEAQGLLRIAETLGPPFEQATAALVQCAGSVVVSGVGKAGHIGRKIAATFCSTGTPAQFIHPSEALHGDAGGVREGDIALILSFSGESAEVLAAAPLFKQLTGNLIAITRSKANGLGNLANIVLELGDLNEACHLGLAPSTSTTAMLALGDALAIVASQMRGFAREDFAKYHPAGSLGLKLAKVEQVMRGLEQCRVALDEESVRSVLVSKRKAGRRPGAIMVISSDGQLSGLFTDSDLARLLEGRQDGRIDGPIRDVMTHNPSRVVVGTRMLDAVSLLRHRKFSELPVVDEQNRPVGMLDITDVIGLTPAAESVIEDEETGLDNQSDEESVQRHEERRTDILRFPLDRSKPA